MKKARKGIYAAAITPIRAGGEPDMEGLVAHCNHLLTVGCDGVAPLGTTGEGAALPFAFRLKVPRALANANLPSDAVIIGAGSPSVGDAIAMARTSLEAGFPNLLVLPPYYTKSPSEDGLYDYYSQIIDAARDESLRIFLYHIPQVTSVPIPIALVHRLRSSFGRMIAGIKDSSGDFQSAKSYLGLDDFDVYPSSEAMLSDALNVGCAGVISGSTNITAALARKILRATGADRQSLQIRLTELRYTLQRFPLIPAVKQVQAWLTNDPGWQRLLPPLQRLSERETSELKKDMERLGVLDAIGSPGGHGTKI
jgi:4-hydroxy-tetrahydrodipicolinate synthase